jgi:hypothetical protein
LDEGVGNGHGLNGRGTRGYYVIRWSAVINDW